MNPLRTIPGLLRKYEFLLYLAALTFIAGTIFSSRWQVDEDGPAHLYNAVVFRELALHPHAPLSDIFGLNSSPVPNSLGHFFLSVCTSFFSLELSDKLIHLLMILGMCFSFRFLCRQINPGEAFYSWFIFPFLYSSIYFFGFYNFYLGIALFLLTSATWFWAEKKGFTGWSVLLLLVTSTALLLCHLIPFLLFVFVSGSHLLLLLFRKNRPAFFAGIKRLFLILAPALIILCIYYFRRTEITNGYHWADKGETFSRLFRLKYLAVYNADEKLFAFFLSLFLLIILAISFFLFFKRRASHDPETTVRFLFWGSCWTVLLLLVFFAPDDFGGSGALTFRLIEISEIFLLLFLTASTLPRNMVLVTAFFCFTSTLLILQKREGSMMDMNVYAQKAMRFSENISPNSTGVYIPLTDNWLQLHLGELPFAEKKSALLSNYETVHDFFLLKWKKEFPYDYTIGGLRSADIPCSRAYWPAQQHKPEKHIDYVLVCKHSIDDPACYSMLQDSLEKYYVLEKTDEPFFLYHSRQNIAAQKH